MVNLIFYGGVDEIGGNKILLEDKGTKIFFDFGVSFNRRGKFFKEFLTPRTANGIGDFLIMKLIPDIRGIYREDLLTHFGRKKEESDIAAVILSHAHADHANYVSFLHKDIPIYCGEVCKSILEAVEEQSQRNIESEVCDFRERPLFRSDYSKPPIERIFKPFRTGDKAKIESIEIEPIHVDHSVPGAYGFIIWTSAGAVVYTGDLRMHGTYPEMTYEFIERAKDAKPIAMITEGTRINVDKTDESESKVYKDTKREVLNNNGTTIADFNFKDVDRFKTFYKIACETEKKFVISFKHACFLERYYKDKYLDVPNSTGDNIFLLKPKLRTGTYCDEDYGDDYIENRLDYPNILFAEDIAKNPEKYLIVLNFWNFNTLIDLNPNLGLYIHSLSEPFNEEMEISYERMYNWINHFNLRFFQSHCSGHICGSELKEMLKIINPKMLFPIHTEHPDMFSDLPLKIHIVTEGKPYDLKSFL